MNTIIFDHPEPAYETAIFFRPAEFGSESYVLAEYQTEADAQAGHAKILEQFKSGKELLFIDTFTKQEVVIPKQKQDA